LQEKYVTLARTWPDYGSYLFKVENHDAQFGQALLTVAVSEHGVSVFKRGHAAALDRFTYEE